MAKDYIEFLSDLKGYINGTLTFIKPEESRWKEMPQVSGDKRFGQSKYIDITSVLNNL